MEAMTPPTPEEVARDIEEITFGTYSSLKNFVYANRKRREVLRNEISKAIRTQASQYKARIKRLQNRLDYFDNWKPWESPDIQEMVIAKLNLISAEKVKSLEALLKEAREVLLFYSAKKNYENYEVLADVGKSEVPKDCPDKESHHKSNFGLSDHDCFLDSTEKEDYISQDIRNWGTPYVLQDEGKLAFGILQKLNSVKGKERK